MDRLGSESITPLGALLKCAAGVLVLVVIAAGPWAFVSTSGPTAANETHPASKPGTAPAESKRIFDERRRAHEAGRDGNVATAGDTNRPSLVIE
jgi:hypothetical protein